MKYKKERAEYNKKVEAEREDNLAKKQAVIDELKALVEKQDDLGAAFPAFRDLQARCAPSDQFRHRTSGI